MFVIKWKYVHLTNIIDYDYIDTGCKLIFLSAHLDTSFPKAARVVSEFK